MQKTFAWERYFFSKKLSGKNYGVLDINGKHCSDDNSIIDDEARNAYQHPDTGYPKTHYTAHVNGMDGNYYTGGKDEWRR